MTQQQMECHKLHQSKVLYILYLSEGTYYCLNMILITLSSFLNVLIVDLTSHGTRAATLPRLRHVMSCMFVLAQSFITSNSLSTNTHTGMDFKVSSKQSRSDVLFKCLSSLPFKILCSH